MYHRAVGRICAQFASPNFKRSFTSPSNQHPRILITGGLGQLGTELTALFRSQYGQKNVITSDIVKPPRNMQASPYEYVDVLNINLLRQTVVNNNINWVVHLAALLSATAEQNLPQALKINVDGLHNLLEVARIYGLRVFVPSTIGAFGTTSPKHNTPDITIQRPSSIYGVTKVYTELLGEYYYKKFGVDFRCLRLPGVISTHEPGGGTTDYAVQIFYDAVDNKPHKCYLRPDTTLPMIYIDDCLNGIAQMMQVPGSALNLRTYNITSMAFSPEQVAQEIKARIPDFEIHYDVCPIRQEIADSWPASLDDTAAQRDWYWRPQYDLSQTTDTMINALEGHRAKVLKERIESKNIRDPNTDEIKHFPAEMLLSKPTA